MSKKPFDVSVYLVTDRAIAGDRSLLDVVKAAVQGGVTIVQLREKHLPDDDMIALGKQIQQITHAANIPLIVNDRINVALALDADGVHVGQDDMLAEEARRLIGPDCILGVSVENVAQTIRAEQAGADYLGAADIYGTLSKPDVNPPIGLNGLTDIVRSTQLPVVAIGGITIDNTPAIIHTGAEGVAVISAIVAATDPETAARNLLRQVEQAKKHNSLHTHDTIEKGKMNMSNIKNQAATILARLRETKPLVHHMTNFVVMNDTANATLHLGASPVMAHAIEEVAEMTGLAGALVLNIGTLTHEWCEAMISAGRAANSKQIPIVFDPVGAGATTMRTHIAHRMLRELDIQIVRGNAGEIGVLSGLGGEVRGVDSVAAGDSVALARHMAENHKTVAAITGKRDVISDGTRTFGVDNGHQWLTTLTGTGCMSTTAIAAFAAVEPDYVIAAAAALASYGLAAEKAANVANGPASFKIAFLDQLYNLTPEDVQEGARIVEL